MDESGESGRPHSGSGGPAPDTGSADPTTGKSASPRAEDPERPHEPAGHRPLGDEPTRPPTDDRPSQDQPGEEPATVHQPDPQNTDAQQTPQPARAAGPDDGEHTRQLTDDGPTPKHPDDGSTAQLPEAGPAQPLADSHADRQHSDGPPQQARTDDKPADEDGSDRKPADDRPGETRSAPQASRPPAPQPPAAAPPTTPSTPVDLHPNREFAQAKPTGTGGTTPGPGSGKPARGREPGGGLLMGRPFGVPVYVAPSWFLVAALITWVFGGQLDRVLPELGAARYLVSLFFAVAFYASVLVHELAHTVVALRYKLPVRRIQLQFFGGVSEIEKESETPGREFTLAFVGPLLSLVLAGVFYAGMQAVEPGTVPGVLLAGLMISNLIVAAFNLLPGLPLDGGRMLRAVVWKITGKPMSGTIAAAWVGRALAVAVLIGLPLLTQSGALGDGAADSVGMDTVMDALLAAILAAIIWTGAGNSLRMARLREHLPQLRARTLTRRAVPVESHTPLSEALRRANEAGARALVVVDGHGDPTAIVREAAIAGVPEHRRPWQAVSGLAQDLTDGMRVSAELAGEELLDTLRAAPATEYLVVEETGEIYGVLSTADVERAFVRAMARQN
ncbi:site-2 protease family protein [Streptomyces sp. NBC_01304]|uniref:site-2 protease family protein n=1 Tax=Streptomyces sp. NBC_01304 TaxID=2903818 RepID=UPI002E0F26DD|nr:site-2 protease family protein [Streptomyces sp. NBC_01304]